MRKFIAFDIGGTLIKYGVLAEDGTIIEKFETPTEAQLGGPVIVDKVKKFGSELTKKYDISGICISTAGQVDSKRGIILYASSLIPAYTGTNLKEELEDFFGLPVEVENDVNCAGLAESWIGTGKDAKSLFCLTVGTGIGGSFILDNKLHTGHSFSAGEIGYIHIEGDQFQELASTRTLVRNVAKRKGILEEIIDGKQIFELAQNGDEICKEEINKLLCYLSKGIATIAYMMNPEIIIIGGGITAQKDYIYPIIMKQLEKDLIPAILAKTKIKIAKNLNNAGMIGALRHFLLQESLQPLKSITTIIESNRHRLTKQEKVIAKYIIANLESVPNKTISELAKQINVSEATITRFCQKLQFGSYNKLRLLAKEAIVSTRIFEHPEATSLVEVKESYLNVIKKFESLHQLPEIEKLNQIIATKDQIYVYAENRMANIAKEVKLKLLKLGIRADAFTEAYEMELSANSFSSNFAAIGISTSGYDTAVVEMMKRVKNAGGVTIGITSQTDSPLSYASDIRLLIPAKQEIEGSSCSVEEFATYYLLDIILKELHNSEKKLKKEEKSS
ncbi:ROK family protein [Bacillus kwashiorkori]|uniref:ROK family protein n=1 Tax=Bacillus kwashiorkori TaxID=1522318 RepID=UPI0008F8CC99|nr:ROK family protein [Bacillus kwashiorkori]